MLTNILARQRILIISGPSGAGKSTVERELSNKYGTNYMISHTSRDPRKGETDGETYYFVSVKKFDLMLAEGKFIDHAYIYDGRGYGLSHDEALFAIEDDDQATIVVNTDGARQIKDMFPDVWSVWVDAPTEKLRERMLGRGDTPEMVAKRFAPVEKERQDAKLVGYDFRIINDDLDQCIAEFAKILEAMKLRT